MTIPSRTDVSPSNAEARAAALALGSRPVSVELTLRVVVGAGSVGKGKVWWRSTNWGAYQLTSSFSCTMTSSRLCDSDSVRVALDSILFPEA